ncbi:hypothetical protein HJG60_011514 [Phyllostomus discolor]|uniref:Uncharacterized protein n=1 Tax=Phyllostomus discolor TaxID=89673 RepID=A0A833ZMW0_9CHIR|nr:hypothetical protein HJG60_011514 [Phyllostomus discolor]
MMRYPSPYFNNYQYLLIFYVSPNVFFFSWDILKVNPWYNIISHKNILLLFSLNFLKRFYLFLERKEGREKQRVRNFNVWLPLICPQLGTWPATQEYALTGNPTGNPEVHMPVLNPLSHTSQGTKHFSKYLT